ncbi:MAG: BatA (Bacteroides aerotolerance operon) [uncultured Sulfurovum sp.]|uniref:BatA (Bacteroides aerotolerance operon) n=1 Tax=uncultured Sulfurovum sp. TaxID=269237 RepID=A0A6S6TDD7_9BACT|nr:MAG: BatA (Bacteroides aerotolerance operon) [uncultured Sulfurovum sp.]
MNFTFLYPYAFTLLLLLPCFWWCKQKVKSIYFPKEEWLPKQSFSWDNQFFYTVLIYTLLVFALAAPFTYTSEANSAKKGRDLVLLLDTSGSMAERGFNEQDRTQTKYDISVALAKDFIEKRYDNNVGLVVFGSFAFSASPLTYDLKALNEMFDLMSDVGIAGTSTAIGDALVQGLATLKSGKAKSKVLILLTDGVHNAGKSSPRQAVTLAQEKGVKVYTIGIGKKADYDVTLLNDIAKDSGGKSFFCQNADELEDVYKSIAQLEPSPIRSEQYLNKEELAVYPLLLALGLFGFLIYRDEETL